MAEKKKVEIIEKTVELFAEARKHDSGTGERQQVLEQLAKQVLSSRPLFRTYKGQPLSGIGQVIYDKVKQQLLSSFEQQSDHFNNKHFTVREWVKSQLEKVCQQILKDDNLLKQLALDAKKTPSGQPGEPFPEERQVALQRLTDAIRLSGQLARPHSGKFVPSYYELLYQEAVNETLLYVCEKIDDYDPQRGGKKFMVWVNYRLDKIILDVHGGVSWLNKIAWKDKNAEKRDKERAEEQEPNKETTVQSKPKARSHSELKRLAKEQEEIGFSDKSLEADYYILFKKCLEEDPRGLFKKKHIEDHPEATFQAIALARLSRSEKTGKLKTWKEITEIFSIKGSSTCGIFYRRCCKEFCIIFQDYFGV